MHAHVFMCVRVCAPHVHACEYACLFVSVRVRACVHVCVSICGSTREYLIKLQACMEL